jgi:hypothetical protein
MHSKEKYDQHRSTAADDICNNQELLISIYDNWHTLVRNCINGNGRHFVVLNILNPLIDFVNFTHDY